MGRGLIPEAVKSILQHGFNELKLDKIWCGYFDGNTSEKIDVIVGSQNGLNPNIVLVVTEILNENATIMIESNEVIEKAYEVTLESDGVSIQPDGDITIKLLIPET